MAEVVYPTVGYGIAVALDEGTGSYNYAVLKESGNNLPVKLVAEGENTNVSISIEPKGTGNVQFGRNAFNYLTIAGGATGQPITITATGGDANVDDRWTHPGQGWLSVDRFQVGTYAAGTTVGAARTFTAFTSKALSGAAPGAVYRFGGSYSGTVDASLTGLYTFAIDSDTVQFSNTSNGMVMGYFGQSLSANWSGGRGTLQAILDVNQAGSAGDISGGSNAYHVAASSFTNIRASMGGNSNDTRGNVFGYNDGATLFTGAGYHINSLVGRETDVGAQAQTEALYKVGHKIGLWRNDVARGAIADYAWSTQLTANITTSQGWRIGHALGGYEAWWPFTSSSTYMKKVTTAASIAAGAPSYALGQGIDFNGITFTESTFKAPGFIVDPSGNMGALTASGVALQTRSAVVAKTAVVNTITVVEGGLYAGAITLTLSAPTTSGTTATASVATWAIAYANSIDTRGSGWAVGDTFQVTGGTFSVQASGVITAVSSGQVFGLKFTTEGNYSVLPGAPITLTATSGVGTGLTITPMTRILTVSVTGAGTNYSEWLPPTVSSAGATATYREAVFKVTMTGTEAPLVLNTSQTVQVPSITVNASGPTMRSGTGAASGTQPKGSIWLRTDGAVGTTLYVSQGGGTWNAVAGV